MAKAKSKVKAQINQIIAPVRDPFIRNEQIETELNRMVALANRLDAFPVSRRTPEYEAMLSRLHVNIAVAFTAYVDVNDAIDHALGVDKP